MKELYKSLKKSKWFPLVVGVLFIAIGIIGLLNPHGKMETIALIIGVGFAVYAVFHVVAGLRAKENKKVRILHFVGAGIVLVLAILDFVNLALIGKYLPTLVGFFMIACAAYDLFHCVILWKNDEKNWWIGAVLDLIVLILGVIFLLKPGYVGQAFGIYAGITLLITGISSLLTFLQVKH